MFFVLSVPFWLFVLLWIFGGPGRKRARQQAAHLQELQTVAAMTEAMKEEYWARKRFEAQAAERALISNGKAASRMAWAFFLIMAAVIVIGIMTGGK